MFSASSAGPNRCPSCGEGLIDATCDERVVVAGLELTGAIPCQRCEACGEMLVAGEALSRLELAAAAELARLGRRSGPALRFMRKALGYRAVELAALLDVAPETLSRWETGEREVEGRAFALVGLLARAAYEERDDVLTTLRAIREPASIESDSLRIVG